MNNLNQLLVTDNNILDTITANYILFTVLFTILVVTLAADKGLTIFEKVWGNLSDRIYDPTTERSDPFGEFTGLDQNVISVVNDTNVRFDDVAGNEEAKDELKRVQDAHKVMLAKLVKRVAVR